MTMSFWSLPVVVAGLLVAFVAARVGAGYVRSPGDLPASPLQRVARWTLVASLPMLVGLAVLVAVVGPAALFERAAWRMLFFGLSVGALGILAAGFLRLNSRARIEPGLVDELDQAILGRAPAFQAIATLLALTVWTIGLTERFSAVGAVPLAYLQIVFWSCLLVYLLGLPVGVLLAYRRQ